MISQVPFPQTTTHIHNFGTKTLKNNNTCFGTYSYSAGTQHGNLHQLPLMMRRMTYFFCGPTEGPVFATANTGKTQERLWKNAGEWTGG